MLPETEGEAAPGLPGLDPAATAEPETIETIAPPEVEGAEALSLDLGPEPEPKKKRKYTKRGTRPKGPVAPQEPAGPTLAETEAHLAAALGFGFSSSFAVLAGRRGRHWELSGEESAGLGQVWARALAPFMAEYAGPWAAFIVAGLTMAGAVLPRMALDDRDAVPAIAAPPKADRPPEGPPARGEGVPGPSRGPAAPVPIGDGPIPEITPPVGFPRPRGAE
jgi:hypothetical protein